jgi:cobalt-zinc-cadmium efflux system outer membrane protein
MEAELVRTFEHLRSAFEEARTLDREILPEARAALEAAEDAYGRGLFRLTDLLDFQRTLFELRTRRLDALVAYHESRTTLERLIGTSIEPDGRD